MRVSFESLQAQAQATGFRAEILEKVIHLLHLLEGLRSHPYLRDRLALKGGTALNLFIFDLPRLSVDIDINYIGAADRGTMLAERLKVEEAVQAVCQREGLAVTRVPDDHAGGKWSLRYQSALGQGGNLDLDLNFMLRVPLWPVITMDSRPLGSVRAVGIPVIDLHELAAGKLAALLSRHQARDLFDAHQLLLRTGLRPERLRVAFVVYGAMSRLDWRTVSAADVDFESRDLENHLVPTLPREAAAGERTAEWGTRLVEECRNALSIVLPFLPTELEFLDRILDHGEIMPSLLTSDTALGDRIRQQPMLAWKAINVRQHKGLPAQQEGESGLSADADEEGIDI